MESSEALKKRGTGWATRLRPRSLVRVAAIGGAITAAATAAAPAAGAAPIQTGFSDGRYRSSDQAVREQAFARTVEAGADRVRINVAWSSVANAAPAAPRDPGDPAYDFAAVDRAVSGANAAGLDVLVTVYSAPEFAEGAGRPASAAPGTWRPDPGAFADFAVALASRYSGSFAGLPRVRDFQAWNEPNLSNFLTPQSLGGRAASPAVYRELLNAFGTAVKSVHADNRVITAGTAPYGDDPGGQRVRPLVFWREVMCMHGRKKPKPTRCPVKPNFDVLAHHPINTSGGPRRSALHPDDVSTPDLAHLRKLLRAAERSRNLAGGRHQLWATELWWDTNPPDDVEGVPVKRHARWLSQALYLLWKGGARVVINLQLQDDVFDPDNPFFESTTGVLFADGSPKPAFDAVRFPFVTERTKRRTLRAWGKAPADGRLEIQRRARGGWRRVASKRVRAGEVFEARLALRGNQRLRARVGGESSLVWSQR